MFSYLLFFSSGLCETGKDLWTIMDFCYELFNKTKQKKKTGPFPFIHLTYHCSHRKKKNQVLLKTPNEKFSNSPLHLAIRFPYCLISFGKWKGCYKRQGERTNSKEMWGGIYLQGSIFKRVPKQVYKMWVNMLLHTHSHFDVRKPARHAPYKASRRLVHRTLHKQGSKRLWMGRIWSKEVPGQDLSLQQIPMICWAWQKAGQRYLSNQWVLKVKIHLYYNRLDPSFSWNTNAKVNP